MIKSLLVALALASPVSGEGFRVIVHPSNPADSLSTEAVCRLFLKRDSTWAEGRRAEPVDLPDKSPTRESFSRAVCGIETRAIVLKWNRSIFAGGKIPPDQVRGDSDVLAWVAARPGAVGYVSEETELEGVKVLELDG